MDAVISGKVVHVDVDGIDVQVIDVLRGVEDRDTIRIWDGTDWDCNGLFSMAASDLGAVGDSIIVVMPLITAVENTWDVIGDYRRPYYFGCITELRIVNGVVSGYITGPTWSAVYEMPYPDLMALWGGSSGTCSGLSVEGLGQVQPFEVQMVNSTLHLTIREDLAERCTVRIHAVSGQEVMAVKADPGTTLIDVSDLASGVYHVVLVQRYGLRSAARVLKL